MVESKLPYSNPPEYPGQQVQQIADDSYWREAAIRNTYDAVHDWKLVDLEGDREVLARVFPTSGLRQSADAASAAAHLALQHHFYEDILISIDPNKVLIVLNMYGEGALPEVYKKWGYRIDRLFSSF